MKNKWTGWYKRPKPAPPPQPQPPQPGIISSATIVATVMGLERGEITPDYPAHVVATAAVEGEWVKAFWAETRERFVLEKRVPIVVAEHLIREHWDELVARVRRVPDSTPLHQRTQRK